MLEASRMNKEHPGGTAVHKVTKIKNGKEVYRRGWIKEGKR